MVTILVTTMLMVRNSITLTQLCDWVQVALQLVALVTIIFTLS